VQGSASFQHQIADARLPQAAPVLHDAAARDTALDKLDARPPLIECLVRPLLLPRELRAAGVGVAGVPGLGATALRKEQAMRFRLRRREHGSVETVPNEGTWYATVEQAASVRRAFEKFPSGAEYWIEDESGQVVAAEGDKRQT